MPCSSHTLSRCSSSWRYSLLRARDRLWLSRIRARFAFCCHVGKRQSNRQPRHTPLARTRFPVTRRGSSLPVRLFCRASNLLRGLTFIRLNVVRPPGTANNNSPFRAGEQKMAAAPTTAMTAGVAMMTVSSPGRGQGLISGGASVEPENGAIPSLCCPGLEGLRRVRGGRRWKKGGGERGSKQSVRHVVGIYTAASAETTSYLRPGELERGRLMYYKEDTRRLGGGEGGR